MPALTYDLIKPLIAAQETRGSTLQVVFRCPVTGEERPSSASVRQGAVSRTKSSMKRSLWYGVRSVLAQTVRSMVGGGMAGSMATTVVHTAGPTGGPGYSFTEEELRTAAVEAFQRVQRYFAWDEGAGRFVAASHLKGLQTGFQELMASVSLTEGWDRSVLARMLAEIAAADGEIADEERELFDIFAGTDVEPIERLVQRDRLTAAELDATTPKVREALVVMATALAMADEDFDASERARLDDFAKGLGISGARAAELTEMAREQVVDMLLEQVYADGHADPEERAMVNSLAHNLGVPRDALDRYDVRVRKRKGLM